jgi:ABC-2 type transport system permease protein
MTREIMVVIHKELKEIGTEGGGGRRGRLTSLIGLLVAGVLLPLNFGVRYVRPDVMPIMGMILPLLFTLPIVADSFAGERERHTLETLLATRLPDKAILFGKLGAIVVYAFALTILALVIGLLSVNVAHAEARPLLVVPTLVAAVLVESVLTATLLAGIGLLISLKSATVRQAQQRVSLVLFVPILIPAIMNKLPPAISAPFRDLLTSGRLTPMQLGLVVLVVLDAAVLYISTLRFRRSRLVTA